MAVNAILDQWQDGIEVLVLENSADPVLSAEDFARPSNIKILRTGKLVSMPENWERGISHASGKYLAYFSDKDILVPGTLAKAIHLMREAAPIVLCYRKGVFRPDVEILHHYTCSGDTTEVQTAPLLGSWFHDARHIHSAPMIYNSFISLEFVNDIRARSGKFFVGSSPDICSGMLIAAYLRSYVQLDLMLTVAFSGAWSNGAAAMKHGMPKQFVSLFRENPFDRLGLPGTVSASVLEVLISLRAEHPQAFAVGSVNWEAFIDRTYKEISVTTRSSADKRREFMKFFGRRSVVPKIYAFKKLIKIAARHSLPAALTKTIDKLLGRFDGARLQCQNVNGQAIAQEVAAWDDHNYRHSARAISIHDALRVAAANNGVNQ